MTVSGATSRIFLVAISPSWRGIWMSMITMLGRSSAARAIPSEAVAAVPTHCMPSTEFNAADSRSANER